MSKSMTLTDYDSDIIYHALIEGKTSLSGFSMKVGNSYLDKLASRFKVNDMAGTNSKSESDVSNPPNPSSNHNAGSEKT